MEAVDDVPASAADIKVEAMFLEQADRFKTPGKRKRVDEDVETLGALLARGLKANHPFPAVSA